MWLPGEVMLEAGGNVGVLDAVMMVFAGMMMVLDGVVMVCAGVTSEVVGFISEVDMLEDELSMDVDDEEGMTASEMDNFHVSLDSHNFRR